MGGLPTALRSPRMIHRAKPRSGLIRTVTAPVPGAGPKSSRGCGPLTSAITAKPSPKPARGPRGVPLPVGEAEAVATRSHLHQVAAVLVGDDGDRLGAVRVHPLDLHPRSR